MSLANLPEIFLDTDVAFDIISKREPFYNDSIKLLEAHLQGSYVLLTSESSVANLIYLSSDIHKIHKATERLIDFISSMSIICGGKSTLLQALKSDFKDKEDAVQYYTALNHGADYFITRNLKDYNMYSFESLPVFSPTEFIENFKD
ncbi:MAG: PIN domain-containing protein [Cyclobacteriaceae bacterium]